MHAETTNTYADDRTSPEQQEMRRSLTAESDPLGKKTTAK